MLLDVKDLRVHYGGVEALKGISLTVESGEIFGYLDWYGKPVTEAKYNIVWDYSEGYARAIEFKSGEGVEFLDLNGNIKFYSPSIEVKDFTEGLAAIQIFNKIEE